METLFSYLLVAMMLASGGAAAHDDATLDAARSPHGGQLRMAGPYHYELVTAANAISVYVTDHAGTKLSTKGVSGSATIASGKREVCIPLRSARDNLVKGSGKYVLTSDSMVTVSLAFPGKSTETARFAPLRKAARRAVNPAH